MQSSQENNSILFVAEAEIPDSFAGPDKTGYDYIVDRSGSPTQEALNKCFAVVLFVSEYMNAKRKIESLRLSNSQNLPGLIVALERFTKENCELAIKAGALDVVDFIMPCSLLKKKLDIIKNNYQSRRLSLRIPASDSLIKNRVQFIDFATKLLKQSTSPDYVLFVFDVDRFGAYTDLFGIDSGNDFLTYIGKQLKTILPENALFGHYHDDFFVGIVEYKLFNGNDLLKKIEQVISEYKTSFRFVVRIGAYRCQNKTLDINKMCDRALIALRSTKNNFRVRFAFFNETMLINHITEHEILDQMEFALQNGHFSIFYQPQYNYSTGKIVGVEALVRWDHPQIGVILPGTYVPVFEKCGFITKLDKFVWNRVFMQIRKWLDKGHTVVPVSLNVSRIDLFETDICAVFSELIKKYEVEPELIHLEITETSYVANPLRFNEIISELQLLGFCVEMDDFGSGYSSLNMLKDVSVNKLKLDISFLSNTNTNNKTRQVLSSIIRMAHDLGLSVIAEGVESRKQADFLKSIGCTDMQGFYFAKPMPARNFDTILARATVANNSTIKNVSDLPEPKKSFAFLDYGLEALIKSDTGIGGMAIAEYSKKSLTLKIFNNLFKLILKNTFKEDSNAEINLFDTFNYENRVVLKNALRTCISSSSEVACELSPKLSAKGKPREWFSVTVKYICDNQGKNVILIFTSDITKTRELTVKYQATSLKYTNIVKNLPGGVVNIKINKKIEVEIDFFTANIASMFGYSQSEYASLFMRNPALAYQKDDMPKLKESLRQIINGKTSIISGRFRHICKDNSYKWIQLTVRTYKTENEIIYASAIVIDVDNNIRSEIQMYSRIKNLEKNRKMFDYICQTVRCGIISITRIGRKYNLSFCNEKALKIFGYNNQENMMRAIESKTIDYKISVSDRDDLIHRFHLVSAERPNFSVMCHIYSDAETSQLYQLDAGLSKVSDEGYDTIQIIISDTNKWGNNDSFDFRSILHNYYDVIFECNTHSDAFSIVFPNENKKDDYKLYSITDSLREMICKMTYEYDKQQVVHFVDESLDTEKKDFVRKIMFRCKNSSNQVSDAELVFFRISETSFDFCIKQSKGETHLFDDFPSLPENNSLSDPFGKACIYIVEGKTFQILYCNKSDIEYSDVIGQTCYESIANNKKMCSTCPVRMYEEHHISVPGVICRSDKRRIISQASPLNWNGHKAYMVVFLPIRTNDFSSIRKHSNYVKQIHNYAKILLSQFDEAYQIDFSRDSIRCLFSKHNKKVNLINNYNSVVDDYVTNCILPERRIFIRTFLNKKSIEDKLSAGIVPRISYDAVSNGKKYFRTSTIVKFDENRYIFLNSDIKYSSTEINNQITDKSFVDYPKISKSFLESISKTTGASIVVIDSQSNSVFISKNFSSYEMSKYPETYEKFEVVSENIVHAEDRESLEQILKTRYRKDISFTNGMVRMKMSDGQYHFTQISVILRRDKSGNLQREIAVFVDKQKEYSSQNSLTQTNEWLKLIINNINDGIAICKSEEATHKLVYYNKRFCDIFAIDSENAAENCDKYLYRILSRLNIINTNSLPDNKLSGELVCTDMNGKAIFIKINVYPIRPNKEKTNRLMIFITDCTALATVSNNYKSAIMKLNEFSEIEKPFSFEYSTTTNTATIHFNYSEPKKSDYVINNYIENIGSTGLIDSLSVEIVYRTLSIAISKRVKGYLDICSNSGCWYRATYCSLENADGSIVRVIGKMEEINFYQTIQYKMYELYPEPGKRLYSIEQTEALITFALTVRPPDKSDSLLLISTGEKTVKDSIDLINSNANAILEEFCYGDIVGIGKNGELTVYFHTSVPKSAIVSAILNIMIIFNNDMQCKSSIVMIETNNVKYETLIDTAQGLLWDIKKTDIRYISSTV